MEIPDLKRTRPYFKEELKYLTFLITYLKEKEPFTINMLLKSEVSTQNNTKNLPLAGKI